MGPQILSRSFRVILLVSAVFFLGPLFSILFFLHLIEYALFFFILSILLNLDQYLFIIVWIVLIKREDQVIALESLLQSCHCNKLVEVLHFQCGGIKACHIFSKKFTFLLFNNKKTISILQMNLIIIEIWDEQFRQLLER